MTKKKLVRLLNMKSIVLIALLIFIAGCKSELPRDALYTSEILKIEQTGDYIFTHISYLQTDNFGNVPCNGMIYFNGDEAIIYDTPTDNRAAAELIDWIQNEQKKKIKAIIVTHFHIDCLGGLQEFHNHDIPSYASGLTIELARENEEILPKNGFAADINLMVGSKYAIAKYFGPGHTADNIVGYIPDERTLFGGCLIKALNAGKGNLSDANTSEWAQTVEKIKNEYPDLQTVIPGHGKNGGKELLDYTIKLFEIK